jgi:hypothetical protein
MRVISQTLPTPRLLHSVVPEFRESKADQAGGRFRLKGASLFTGNGRAIFLGIVLGAILLGTTGFFYTRYQSARRQEETRRKLLTVAAQSHVTAISLGHPRLAIINGQQAAEGDQIVVHTPAASDAITLRILKILDGRIDLSDGTQVISVRLEKPSATSPETSWRP